MNKTRVEQDFSLPSLSDGGSCQELPRMSAQAFSTPYGNQAFSEDHLQTGDDGGGGDSQASFCPVPNENYPYSDDTFKEIKKMSPQILAYAEKYGVPPAAVAGGIADEFNTQTGLSGVGDWIQDNLYLNPLPSVIFKIDDKMKFNSKIINFIEPHIDDKENSIWKYSKKGINKAFNTTTNDVGKGNINVATAKDLLDRFPDDFPKGMDYAGLVDLLRTDEGTAQISAMVIRDAQTALDPYLAGYTDEEKEAVYITYYKQGPSYVSRYQEALAKDPNDEIGPGEGCGTFLQRQRMLKALGLTGEEASGAGGAAKSTAASPIAASRPTQAPTQTAAPRPAEALRQTEAPTQTEAPRQAASQAQRQRR